MSSNDPSFGGDVAVTPRAPSLWAAPSLQAPGDMVRASQTWIWWCQGLSGMAAECSCPQGAQLGWLVQLERETEARGCRRDWG